LEVVFTAGLVATLVAGFEGFGAFAVGLAVFEAGLGETFEVLAAGLAGLEAVFAAVFGDFELGFAALETGFTEDLDGFTGVLTGALDFAAGLEAVFFTVAGDLATGFALAAGFEGFATGLDPFAEGFVLLDAEDLVALVAATALVAGLLVFTGAFAFDFPAGSAFTAFLAGAATGALGAFPGLSFALMRAVRLTMMTFLVWADFKPLSSQKKQT
jgi:hypothetical protein